VNKVRLNLGCGNNPLPGYVNVDLNTVEEIMARYPDCDLRNGPAIHQYDILQLPFSSSSIEEVRADSLLEHLSFLDEPKFFNEVRRVLKPGGIFRFTVQNFELVAKRWLEARDEWKAFYKDDPDSIRQKHWFGQYSYTQESRWGYLTAMIFGNQKGVGQFHRNCYTRGKIEKVMERVGFEIVSIEDVLWKEARDPMLSVLAKKR
jgi:predicted SAM-dependent methyltransferase